MAWLQEMQRHSVFPYALATIAVLVAWIGHYTPVEIINGSIPAILMAWFLVGFDASDAVRIEAADHATVQFRWTVARHVSALTAGAIVVNEAAPLHREVTATDTSAALAFLALTMIALAAVFVPDRMRWYRPPQRPGTAQ